MSFTQWVMASYAVGVIVLAVAGAVVQIRRKPQPPMRIPRRWRPPEVEPDYTKKKQ